MNDFQSIYDQVIKELKVEKSYDQTLLKIKECRENQDRVQFVSQLETIKKHLNIKPSSKLKSADLSIKLRNEGNKFFQTGEYQKALDKYNQSVTSAPIEAKTGVCAIELKGNNLELSYALANRSAVFFHQKHYDLCLNDIDYAIQNKYPKILIYKLHERRAKCYVELQAWQKSVESFQKAMDTLPDANLEEKKLENVRNSIEKQIEKIKKKESNEIYNSVATTTKEYHQFHGPLPTIVNKSKVFPCASDAVGITADDVTEFGLAATQDILVGESLIVEKAYTSIVLPKFDTIYCHHCCQRVISVFPCHQCSEVVFCGLKCYKESWEMYHYMECVCLGTVKQADLGLGYLALKMVLKAGLPTVILYKGKELIDGCQRSVGFNDNGVYDPEDYNSVYHLVNHSEKRTPEDLFKRSFQAYFLLKCLEETDFFTKDGIDTSSDDINYVAGHILRHIMMLPCNAHEVSELALNLESLPESETKEIGSGIYPTLSLINHSCDPNVVRHSYGDTCVVRAIKNIAEGEEIVDNYGALYPLTVRSERRITLEPQYYFKCNCQPCREDWPLYFNINVDVPNFKCQKCHGPVVIPLDNRTENSFCIQCKQKQDITDIIVKLHQSQTDYKNILEQVLRGEKLQEALPKLETYLQFLYKTVCTPWQDCNNCQEAIKQCYAVKASCYIAN